MPLPPHATAASASATSVFHASGYLGLLISLLLILRVIIANAREETAGQFPRILG